MMKYCVTCGEMVLVDDAVVEGHTIARWMYTDCPEVLFCEGPFEDCEPEVDEDWDVNLPEPSQEELAKMSLTAEELMQDFESE